MLLFQVSRTAKAAAEEIVWAKKGEMLPPEVLVKNVVNFKFDPKKTDFENVRAFVENGGLRTAPKATSGKTFGDVLYVPNDMAIKVGEKPINRQGKQVIEPVTLTIPAGLYTYSNDTEGAITLIPLDDPARQVNTLFQKSKSVPELKYSISLGSVRSGGKVMPNDEAVNFIKSAIQSTQWLFKNNPNMSVMVEKIMLLLYRGGKGLASVSEQNAAGIKALRTTAKSVMSGMTADNVADLAELIANSSTTMIKPFITEKEKSIAKDMLLLTQDAPCVIGLRVDYGKIYLNIYSGSKIPKIFRESDTFNPVVVHSFSFTDKASFPTAAGYRKEFTGPGGWLLSTEVDYDNPRAVWEGMRENQLRALYNSSERSLFIVRPRLFVVDVTIRPEEFNRMFEEALKGQNIAGMVPKKAG